MKTNLLALCFWAFLPVFVSGQISNLRFEHLIIPDASELGSVDCMFEDSRGFMWFGTYFGLLLFDGYKITKFNYKPNDSTTISDNKIRKIFEDKKGNLWVGTQNGLNYFDIKKRKFTRFTDTLKNRLGVFQVNDIKHGMYNSVWVANVDGLYEFNEQTLQFKKQFPQSIARVAIVNAIEFKNDSMFIATRKGLYFKENIHSDFKIIYPKNLNNIKDTLDVNTLQKDPDGTIWVGTSTGVYLLKTENNTISFDLATPLLSKDGIYFINYRNDNTLWMGTNNGLVIFNTKTFQFERYTNSPMNIESISQNNVERGYHSSNNIYWSSTISGAVQKVDFQKCRFQNIQINAKEAISTARMSYEIYEFAPDTLLIPRKIGACFLNIKTKQLTPFPYKPSFNLEGWKTGMICFLEEKDGKLWIGTNGGLFLFDKIKKQFIDVESNFPEIRSFRGNAIRKIHRDRQGIMWIGTWHDGICKINFSKKTFKRYNDTPQLLANLVSNTRSILEDSKGNMWFGTRGGLLKYMEHGDTFKIYRNIPNNVHTMSENTAFCLYEDVKGNIWCGTYGGGVNKLDIHTDKFQHYTVADGLLDNSIFSLMADKKGNVWASSTAGINVFNPYADTIKFINYTKENGLLNEGFIAFVYGKSKYKDVFYYAAENGIDYFYPDSIQLSNFNPSIYITDLKLFNNSVPISKGETDKTTFRLKEDISFTKHLTLAYDQNVITFEYAALDYSAPKNIQYAYILEGFDKDWQYVGNNRSATFTNLNPGDYLFKVKATNSDGVWGTKTASLKLTVLAPWWRTWWFRSLVFLSLLGIGISFYRYRFNQISEREAIKTSLNKRIAEVKMEALRAQMNPHFMFNALTSINLFVLKNDTDAASFYLNKFSKLMRDVLDHSRSELITVEEEINTLKLYVEIEKMRFKENFTFKFDIDPEARLNEFKIPPLIIQPYVENAIWHGLKNKKEGEALLTIKVFEDAKYFNIIVEDNGIGRDKAKEIKESNIIRHKSHGLKLTEERIKYFNETYAVQSSLETNDLKNANHEAIGTQIVYKIKI